MKDLPDRKKVVVRHLPPTITQDKFMEQVDVRFSGLYNWVSFFPGNKSHKIQASSRAYIDFKRPEDVIDFSDFFNGRIFVNEKGTQFKSIVEYAPSQHIPKQWSKKDGREGSIYRDPEFMEFLEFISKPVENLPSAEIQLERREAKQSFAVKESPIITPLMEFIRQKRAAKIGSRRSLPNGKLHRKAIGPSSASSRHGSDRKKLSTSKYVLKETAKSTGKRDNPAYILISKRDDQVQSNKAVMAASGAEVAEGIKGPSGAGDTGKKKILLLLKKNEKEILHSDTSSAVKDSLGPVSDKSNLQSEASGKIIRSILLNKDARPNTPSQLPDQQNQDSSVVRDRRLPRPQNIQSSTKETIGERQGKITICDWHGFPNEKQGKRMRNKDKPDRGVWTLRSSNGSHARDESLSSSTIHSTKLQSDFSEGSHRHNGRRGVVHKDAASTAIEGKLLKRGVAYYGSQEKQVWVQKSSSGS